MEDRPKQWQSGYRVSQNVQCVDHQPDDIITIVVRQWMLETQDRSRWHYRDEAYTQQWQNVGRLIGWSSVCIFHRPDSIRHWRIQRPMQTLSDLFLERNVTAAAFAPIKMAADVSCAVSPHYGNRAECRAGDHSAPPVRCPRDKSTRLIGVRCTRWRRGQTDTRLSGSKRLMLKMIYDLFGGGVTQLLPLTEWPKKNLITRLRQLLLNWLWRRGMFRFPPTDDSGFDSVIFMCVPLWHEIFLPYNYNVARFFFKKKNVRTLPGKCLFMRGGGNDVN